MESESKTEENLINSPKVSIVVPVYNAEKYLPQALDSIVHQTLLEIEIILINDGSPDDSLRIMQEYASRDDRIVIIDQPNGGVGRAINAGIDAAHGEYLAHMDADDYISTHMLEELYNAAQKNDLDLAISNYYKFSGEYETFKRTEYRFHTNRYFYGKVFSPDDFLKKDANYLKGFAWCQTWSTLYRRAFIEQHGIRWNENVRAYNDLGFWFQTRTLARRLMYLDRFFYFYRQDNVNSTINSLDKMFPDRVAESLYVEQKLREQGIYQKFKDLYYDSKIKAYLHFVLPRIAFELKFEFIKRISTEFSGYLAAETLSAKAFDPPDWNAIIEITQNPAKWFASYVKEKYKVSVVLLFRDHADKLREILDMLLEQTLQEIEVVAVDCGSSDASTQILKEYINADKRVLLAPPPPKRKAA
jgi:glycosyltransferase involved in cell wall biosynthesis